MNNNQLKIKIDILMCRLQGALIENNLDRIKDIQKEAGELLKKEREELNIE